MFHHQAFGVDVIGFSVKPKPKKVLEYRKSIHEMKVKGLDLDEFKAEQIKLISKERDIDEIILSNRGKDIFPAGRGMRDWFYCIDKKPVFTANIMGSDIPEIFIISGMTIQTSNIAGAGTTDYLNIDIFNGDQLNRLISIPLATVDYRELDSDQMKGGKKYYYEKTELRNDHLMSVDGEGRKRYAKLFVQDFDDNERLDLIVWHREYKSALFNKKNINDGHFVLDKHRFDWYEDNGQGGLVKNELSTRKGQKWLASYQLLGKQVSLQRASVKAILLVPHL